MPVSPRCAAFALIAAAAVAAPARADLLIDSFDDDNLVASLRSAGSAPLALVTVSAPVHLDAIGARVDLDAPGAIRFLVFDVTNDALIFASAPKSFADDGIGYKTSDRFATLVLRQGVTYAIGGVADVGGRWSFDIAPAPDDVEGRVTVSGNANANVSDFDAPVLVLPASANVHVQLHGSAAPEPASVGLVALGAAGLWAVRRRRP